MTHNVNLNLFFFTRETRFSRKFFINKNYGGCDSDAGWFVVEDVRGSKPCKWDKHKSYPQFLYSRNGRITKWNALRKFNGFLVFVSSSVFFKTHAA